ncbi:hypothetical protein C2S53_005348 [Perilla frutescens var. hirtella]|uniref:C3H1-type domain-containing protein n=1 Tax=Perilla frutescens var. hirtella TaxID=608512 RepID=A0AAD4PCL5_PERFH|nr:hypothetical protein C2S53_005348 [Perilla frutescens var. hirtella]
MYEFKVRKCNRSRSHDWTDCPFAHPGEKARRRDPRRYHYSGTVCSEFRKGHCAKGDNCDFSHGVFECWLHPSRYRTEACKDGKNCKRKVCFFAHSTRQLRIVPETISSPTATSAEKNRHHCCIYCHSMTASPTSTLMGHVSHSHSNLSPPLSPPISPVCSPDFSPYGGSRFGSVDSCSLSDQFHDRGLSYKDALTELMASFEAMNANEVSSPAAAGGSLPWVDVNFNVEEQPQFVLSPSAPMSRRGHSKFYGGEQSKYNFHGDFSGRNLMEDSRYNYNNEGNSGGPDLGWVNDLLT